MRIPDNTGLVQDPFHLGAVILDKIIGDLKTKLPFLKKKKGGDDDLEDEDEDGATETEVSADDAGDEKTSVAKNLKSLKDDEEDDGTSPDEVTEDNSLVGKIKAKLNSLKKKEAAGEENDAGEEGDEKAKKSSKKKPNIIVIAGAVALIGFVMLSDFGDETPTTEVATDTPTPKKTPKKKLEQPAEEKPADATTTPDATVTTAPDPTTTTTPDATVTTAPDVTTTPPDMTTIPDTTVTTTPDPTTTTTPDVAATPTPDMATTPDNGTVDSVTGDDPTQSPDNLTEQILKDLENQSAPNTSENKPVRTDYVTPPNYENVGRGLVYNCSGQHWACVDAPSYKVCEDNSSSTKFLKKKAECYPFNVYETQSGCEKMQNRMVSSSAKTEFCTE